MKHTTKLLALIATIATCLTTSGCKEDIDTSARYVFTDNTVLSYLEKHEVYSEYCQLLHSVKAGPISSSTVAQLLSARGHYTVFAPTNQAISNYLDSLVAHNIIPEPSWDAFPSQNTLDSVREVIVYNSIIDSGDDMQPYNTTTFPTTHNGEFPLSNMYQRKLVVGYSKAAPDSLWINGQAVDSDNRNIELLNGMIHQLHGVVAPTNNSLGTLLENICNERRRGYYVSSMLVKACGLTDTLRAYRDDTYEKLYLTGKLKNIEHTSGIGYTLGRIPEHRYYGFTFFAETDEVWEQLIGKDAFSITVDDVVSYLETNNIYPEASRNNDYTSEQNLLNQFVTYHFLPMRLAADRFVLHWNEKGYSSKTKEPSIVQYDYYTTMGKRRLMKFLDSPESKGVYINRFPKIDNGRHGTYRELYCDKDKVGVKVNTPEAEGEFNVRNGIVYPLDELLLYTPQVRNLLHKERIRWDVCAMLPEFMNNDIRLQYFTLSQRTGIPMSKDYNYLQDCYIGDDTYFFYYNGYNESMKNYQGDELNIRGNLDVTFRLPPVPASGTYELRFNIQSDGYNRGMVQFYWGSNRNNLPPMGIPLDIRMSGLERRTTAGTFPSNVGWERDTEDDDYNSEVDKKMRNVGFMKGAEMYCDGGQGMNTMARADPLIIRRVILRQKMEPDQTYYLRFKTVLDDPTREFYMDYLEFCPKEVYDNPEEQEDIW